MWLWGLDAQHFLAPFPGWTLWALGALALVPPLARPLAAWAAHGGDAIENAPRASALFLACTAALLAWAMPDRTRFVGDFELRMAALETGHLGIAAWSHGALPLEILLHERLIGGLHALGAGWSTATRLLGALEAALLGALAVAFARALRLRGAAAIAAAAVMLCGGALTLFTGYTKAFSEVALATAAVAVLGLGVVNEGRGLAGLGIVVAAALATHRSALALLVPLMAAWAIAARAAGPRRTLVRPEGATALILPLAALALVMRGMAAAMRRYDAPHFVPPGEPHGALAAALAPRHLLDLANLTAQLSPLALALPLLAPFALALGRARRREGAFLLALLLPQLGLMLFVHPHQGLFRDLDCFAPAGVALSACAAWLVGRAIEGAPGRAWLAVAVVLGVAAPAVQWMLLPTDLDRGLARARAFMQEPPSRSATERAETWDFLGLRTLRLERYAEAAEAFEHAAETAPSPRILKQWGIAEANQGHVAAAESLYLRSVEGDPRDPAAWRGLMRCSFQLLRWDQAKRAAQQVLVLRPGDPDAPRFLRAIASAESSSIR